MFHSMLVSNLDKDLDAPRIMDTTLGGTSNLLKMKHIFQSKKAFSFSDMRLSFSIATVFFLTHGIDAFTNTHLPLVAPNAPRLSAAVPSVVDPVAECESKLIILQITDVYTLENFAHFKTLIEEAKKQSQGAKVVSMLTGDFLSPYLLSKVDNGAGMMKALADAGVDYLTFGNHEADIEHEIVCEHVRNFPGTFINSNMLDHEAMDAQEEYEVIEVPSLDGSQTRKVGLAAVLSDDPALYRHFQGNAFGGATITDPWEALTKYQRILEQDENCDLVIPLQHTYVPDDHRTCQEFDFPLVLSGHDHHVVDEVVCNTRLIKPGMNAIKAAVIEISWANADQSKPTIESKFVKCADFPADPKSEVMNERAYDALVPLQNTQLAPVPPYFQSLSSNNSRSSVCSMGQYICTLLRLALNVWRKGAHRVDAVLLMGGNIRGNTDYEPDAFFSMEALEAEIKDDEVVAVLEMPGWLLAKAITETHSGDPIPGWMQYDNSIQEDTSGDVPVVTHVAGGPLDEDRVYRVATKISDLTNGQSPSLTEYYLEHSELLPPQGAYVNIRTEILGFFARNLWRKLWAAISQSIEDSCSLTDGCEPESLLEVLDSNGDGTVTVAEIQAAMSELLDFSVDDRETTLAEFVHAFADATDTGKVTVKDFELFCETMATSAEEKSNMLHEDQFRRPFPQEKVMELA